MSFEEKTAEIKSNLKCQNCGANLQYKPGTTHLKCSYCGTENEIEPDNEGHTAAVEAVDFEQFAKSTNELSDERFKFSIEVVHCNNCGANSTLNPNITTALCAFCASPLVIDHQLKRLVKPHGLIPFGVAELEAFAMLKKWAGKLWFAPNDFKMIFDMQRNRLNGVYIPFWCFDADTTSDYRGSRGEYYYVTRTRRNADGKEESYEERETNWYNVSGRVNNHFENIVVTASATLSNNMVSKIGPWNIDYVKPFKEEYLSGFIAETFSVEPSEGKEAARNIMESDINYTVRRDIGGDTQRVFDVDTEIDELKIKYILLPLWLSAYKYKGKSYQIMVNAFTGKVYGKRPYSVWKIVFFVLGIILFLLILSTLG